MFSYSNLVKWTKILFPILAIGAVVFVMSVNWTNDAKIIGEFDEEDKIFQENSANVEKPKLDITTISGDNYKLEATSIESIDGSISQFTGGDVSGDLTLDDSKWAVSSENGFADVNKQTVEFENNVKGVLDGEYSFETDQLFADIATQKVTGQKRVEMVGKIGQVAADSFEISGKPTERIITFTGNVVGFINVDTEKLKVENEQ